MRGEPILDHLTVAEIPQVTNDGAVIIVRLRTVKLDRAIPVRFSVITCFCDRRNIYCRLHSHQIIR